MVNPNDPTLEPDGIPSSDSTPEFTEMPSSESEPIDEALFDFAWEPLAASSSGDEPAALPDLWWDQPSEAVSSPEEVMDEAVENPTLIQADPEVETSPSSLDEQLSTALGGTLGANSPLVSTNLWGDEAAYPSPNTKENVPEPRANEIPLPVDPFDDVEDPTAIQAGFSDPDEATPLPPIPDPLPMPDSGSTAVGSSPPSSASGDLGALSGKLPLNRHQAVGLLIALSTLGTITYLGITGNNAEQPLPLPQTATSSPPPPAIASTPPSGNSPTVVPPQPETGNVQSPERPVSRASDDLESKIVVEGSNTPPAVPSQLDISDVPASHWAYPFITKLHAQGIIPDYPDGKFQPDKPVTRAELAAQIQRAFVNEPGQRTLTFSDIASEYWAAKAIEGAVNKQFMSGYPEGDFRPDKLVPRYEVLVALVSGLELDLPSSPTASLQRFQDQAQLPAWSKGKIAASTQGGMVVNHPQPALLEPKANATRAEVAVMIYQALVNKQQLEPISSEFVIVP
jgi:hypothetical protein